MGFRSVIEQYRPKMVYLHPNYGESPYINTSSTQSFSKSVAVVSALFKVLFQQN
jgi:hypothetical protein